MLAVAPIVFLVTFENGSLLLVGQFEERNAELE